VRMKLSRATIDFFERLKSEYKFVFYCPKKDEIYLVECRYSFKEDYWLKYADKELFGKDIKQDRAMKTWVYLGMI
jgi:hypothetical protein